MLDKSTFERFSYLVSRWIAKRWRQLATSTMHLAQELLMNVQCSGGSSFAKETRALKGRSIVAGHRKLTMTNWKESLKLSSYNDTRSWQRTQCWPFYGCLAFEANWKGQKARYIGASWSDWKFKKLSFWSVVSSYSIHNNEPFLNWIVTYMWRKLDFIQLAMTSSMLVLALSKAKLAPKKGHGHCLMVCCWSDTLQLSESQWNHYIWEVCSAAGIRQQKGLSSSPWQCPTARHTTNASKVERTGLQSFASSSILTWPLANQLPLLQASRQLFSR